MKIKLTRENLQESRVIAITFLSELPLRLTDLFTTKIKDEYKPLAKNKRSFYDTIIHLINCQFSSSYKIYSGIMKPNSTLVKLHPERDWGKMLSLEQLDIRDLLKYYQLSRVILVRTLEQLSSKQWDIQFEISGKKKALSIYQEVRSLALHEQQHFEILLERIS